MRGGSGARSPTERETAETLGKGHTGAPTLLLCPAPDGLAGPPAGLGKLRAMALDRGGLALDRLGDIDPLVGFERARQQDRGHLMGRSRFGKVQREGGRRRHGIQQSRARQCDGPDD